MQPISGNLKANSSLAIAQFAKDGLGIAYLPHFTISAALHEKHLVPLLQNHWTDPLPIYALYHQKKHLNKKMDVILETLSDFFTPAHH